MTVASYLKYIADLGYVRDSERESIRTSIAHLQSKLASHFGSDVKKHFIFGSYSRDTILPRFMDEQSDVDYMVVFSDNSLRPQSYLDRLRRFVETHYARSEVEQSNPTIQLSLNHIRFELVPATEVWIYGLQIPAKASISNDWISTDPTGFNDQLTAKNKEHGSLIKPLTRIVKYWNAANGHVFESYALEQKIVDFNFYGAGFFGAPDLESYFFEFMSSLSLPYFSPTYKEEKLRVAKGFLNSAKGYKSYDPDRAERELRRLLPDPAGGGLASALLRGR